MFRVSASKDLLIYVATQDDNSDSHVGTSEDFLVDAKFELCGNREKRQRFDGGRRHNRPWHPSVDIVEKASDEVVVRTQRQR